MNQQFRQHDPRDRDPAISRRTGPRRLFANAALTAAVSLCTGGMALAEESQEHHGTASSGHDSSHSAFSYTFAELKYINITEDEEGADLDGNGIELEVSVALSNRFHAFALYEDIGFDHDIDLTEWAAGFGAHWNIVPGMDFVTELGYLSEEVTEPGHEAHSDDGYLLAVNLRKKIGEQSEIQLGIDFADFSEAGSTTSFGLVGEMHVLPRLAVGAGIDMNADSTTYFAEARYYFGEH